MGQFTIQCLTTYEEFFKIKNEWEEFISRFFPSNYSRTFPWLAAWWNTYHSNKRAVIYIQRDQEGKIISAAPLYYKWENFSGLPVRVLHLLGNGVGTDDFLVTHETKGFVSQILNEISKKKWHVAQLNRVADELFLKELLLFLDKSKYNYTISDSIDFIIRLPKSYTEYLQSRTRKFRRNLNQADNRLNKMGQVEFKVLDPFKDAVQVQEAGEAIARTSWQYKEGRSHFNNRDGVTLYSNLAKFDRGVGGEDFNLLLVDGRPVAYLLGCRRDRIYYAIDTAFHEDFRNVSAGRILFGRIIERLIAEQEVDILDFEGAGEYKDDYANDESKIKSVTLHNNSLYSSIIYNYRESLFYAYLKRLITNSPVSTNNDVTSSNIQE